MSLSCSLYHCRFNRSDLFDGVTSRTAKVNERTLSLFLQALRERKRPKGKTGPAPVTIKNYLIALKTALGWAARQRLIQAVPAFPDVAARRRNHSRCRPKRSNGCWTPPPTTAGGRSCCAAGGAGCGCPKRGTFAAAAKTGSRGWTLPAAASCCQENSPRAVRINECR